VPLVFAGHQRTAQGRADWRCRKGVGETEAFSGHRIDARSLDVGIPHVAEFEIGQFVRHEIDDVGRTVVCHGKGGTEEKEENGSKFHGSVKG